MAESPVLIFIHIPKTAGTSLSAVLEEQYSRERSYSTSYSGHHPHGSLPGFHALSPARLEAIDLLYGHMPYGLHDKLPRPAQYVTFLREPVSRVISNYFFEGREPGSHLHEQVRSGAMDLDGYLDYVRDLGIDNIQTRMIAGVYDPDGGVPLTPDMLRRAQENLERCFAFVGLQEAFGDSYLMLRRRFGWRFSDYGYHGVAPASQGRATVPERVRERIAREHSYDVALYQFAKEMFDRRRAADESTLALERIRFRFWRVRHRLAGQLQEVYCQLRRFSIRYWLRHHLGRQL